MMTTVTKMELLFTVRLQKERKVASVAANSVMPTLDDGQPNLRGDQVGDEGEDRGLVFWKERAPGWLFTPIIEICVFFFLGGGG